ncbi:MAG: CotH kinase family protein, partial [Planctomycetales bacterium]|nr:CotH kinase family protein [Planctomycetales bacterium]
YVQDFEDALFGPNSTDPELGYQAYLDIDPTIDHHLMRVFSKDPDGLRLSTYLVKDKDGKLYFGPIWDFDRSAGPDDDGRAADPTGWNMPDVQWFESDWWGPLFDDPNFRQRWVDRWQELRNGVLSDANIEATIDSLASQLTEAEVRNFDRWPNIAPNGGAYAEPGLTGWAAEVSHLAGWLIERAHWMDEQMISTPTLSPEPGNVASNVVVTITPNELNASVYYTLDGTDPRLSGGELSPSAILYTGPIQLSQTTQILARAKGGSPEATPQSNSSYPGNESPAQGIDGNSETKYLNFGKENSGLIITPSSGASVVRSFKITSANDAVDRDPASYEIYGTNDSISSQNNSTGLAENWTLISSGSLSLPEARKVDAPLVSFANGASYTSYKIMFPTVKNPAGANSMQFADIRLYENATGVGPEIQSAGDPVLAVHVYAGGDNVGGSEWSALVGGLYSIETPANATNLRITELHYHPAAPTVDELTAIPSLDADDFEFVELANLGANAISLNGVALTSGVTFDFTASAITSLQPGATVLVVSNLNAFQLRYGTGLPVAGVYGGQLSNGGEQIVLVDGSAQTIHDFTFDDVAPWPTASDGGGSSMEVVDVNGDYNDGSNWRASSLSGGSPGQWDTTPGDFDGDQLVTGFDFLAWQRGFGSSYQASDLSDWEAGFGAELTLAAQFAATQAASTAQLVADVASVASEWFVASTSLEATASLRPIARAMRRDASDSVFAQWRQIQLPENAAAMIPSRENFAERTHVRQR